MTATATVTAAEPERARTASHGFTLVELVIVMVIIGILAAISVPIYKGYTKKAMAAEGKVLVGTVAKAEKAYYVEFNRFVSLGSSSTGSAAVNVDSRTNKYFTAWAVATAGTGFTVSSTGTGDAAGITVQYVQTDLASSGRITSTGE